MGWAKYLEDIASRHNGTSLVQNQFQKELGRVARPGSPKAAGKIKYDELIIDTDVAKVSVVGIGMRSQVGVAARTFEALAAENINIKVISTSEIKISVLIDRKYMELAVQALHDAFELEKA